MNLTNTDGISLVRRAVRAELDHKIPEAFNPHITLVHGKMASSLISMAADEFLRNRVWPFTHLTVMGKEKSGEPWQVHSEIELV